jgi:hypothetical protein
MIIDRYRFARDAGARMMDDTTLRPSKRRDRNHGPTERFSKTNWRLVDLLQRSFNKRRLK